MEGVSALADLEGGYGGGKPPFKFQNQKRVIKQSKNRRQSSWKGRRENEFHVSLVFMCTRVVTCINKHFLSKFSSSTSPLWKISGSAPVARFQQYYIPRGLHTHTHLGAYKYISEIEVCGFLLSHYNRKFYILGNH